MWSETNKGASESTRPSPGFTSAPSSSMPLRRPSLRSKSRSPAPPHEFEHSSRQGPSFLPPSHYAAAAGLAYHTSDTGNHAYETNDIQRETRSRTTLDKSGRDYGNSSASPNGQSQKGIPMLEAQLLPSLRDTISKMTRSPSRGSRATETSISQLAVPRSFGRSASALDYYSNPPQDAGGDTSTLSTPRPCGTPNQESEYQTPRIDTPRSRPKSVLKNVLRSPMVKSSPVRGRDVEPPSAGNTAQRQTTGTPIDRQPVSHHVVYLQQPNFISYKVFKQRKAIHHQESLMHGSRLSTSTSDIGTIVHRNSSNTREN